MKILKPDIDVEVFFSRATTDRLKILLLDYDGTLAPFKIDPGKAFPFPGVREILHRINQSPRCRLVVVSGRYTRDLIPLLALDPLPEIWGSHGLERRFPDGGYEVDAISPQVQLGFQKARRGIKDRHILERLEEKPGCLALHWRGMADVDKDKIQYQISEDWSEIARQFNLDLKSFDGGVELRVPGKTKGDVVKKILSEADGEPLMAYLGDDLTDEDAFKVMQGKGLSVLVRKELRQTMADVWIRPPDELMDFLIRWRDSCCQ